MLSNDSYAILNFELPRVGAPTATASALERCSTCTSPVLDLVSLATGMGVPTVRAETAADFYKMLSDALSESGPRLVEAVIDAVVVDGATTGEVGGVSG